MGLLLFKEPDSPSKSALKSDPTAAARSSIRRQHPNRSQVHAHDRQHASRRRSPPRRSQFDEHTLFEIIRRDHDNDAQSNRTEVERRSTGTAAEVALADESRREASIRQRVDGNRALLRDPLSYERSNDRLRNPRESSLRFQISPDSPPPRPDTLTMVRSDMQALEQAEHLRNARRSDSPAPPYMPTPPYTSIEQRPTETADHNPRRSPRSYFSSRFAPAYGSTHDSAEDRELPRLAGHPRFSSLRPTQDVLDGLGDRLRSWSPEENQWSSLQVAPDDRLPTPDSSFTSASASFGASAPTSNVRADLPHHAYRDSPHPTAFARSNGTGRAGRPPTPQTSRTIFCDDDEGLDSDDSSAWRSDGVPDPAIIDAMMYDEPITSSSSAASSHDRSISTSTASSSATTASAPSSQLQQEESMSTALAAESTPSLAYLPPLTRTSARSSYIPPIRHRHVPGGPVRIRTPPANLPDHRTLNHQAHAAATERLVRAHARGENLHRMRRRNEGLDAQLRQMNGIIEAMQRDQPVPDELWAGAGMSRDHSGAATSYEDDEDMNAPNTSDDILPTGGAVQQARQDDQIGTGRNVASALWQNMARLAGEVAVGREERRREESRIRAVQREIEVRARRQLRTEQRERQRLENL
ncbi:hypothetical protein MMC25_002104 [Agyrium rufum]|nr:hypothetical protein [Agyrium rufum]